MPYDVADTVPLAWDVKDSAGALIDADTVTLTLTLPDGTATPLVVTNPPAATGQYRVTYLPTVEGRYVWRAVTTGPNTAYQDAFEVRTSVSPALLSLADTKTHLRIPAATTAFDDQLREFIEAATEIVESYVGPIVHRSYVRRVTGGRDVIILPHTQILSVESFTPVQIGVPPLPLTYLAVDSEAGDIRRTDRGYFPWGLYDVAYTVGRTYTKSNWGLAAKIIIKHNWETQLGGLPSTQGGDLVDPRMGTGYLVPFRAVALLNIPNSAQPMVY
jgi:hypothetical protein